MSAEELLWCSGSKATSPLCVEFNQALESRARADELKNFLSEIDKPPWSPESYETAIDLYGKARAQFNDEYLINDYNRKRVFPRFELLKV